MAHRERAPDPSCAPTGTRGTLDFGWWASNGPTAGYLMRLALDAIGDACGTDAGVRRIELRVSRLASAGPFELAIAGAADPADIELLRVTFDQGRPFATATVLRARAAGAEVGGDASPPAALPRDAYRPMPTPSPTLPPVTGRFVYRPTEKPDGGGPRPGWDVVWVTPTDHQLQGRALVVSIIDSWYPAHYMRAVREHLRRGVPLGQPEPTALVAASVSFTAPEVAYDRVDDAVLASQATATADGYYFEGLEVWSDRVVLLASAEILRCQQVARSAR